MGDLICSARPGVVNLARVEATPTKNSLDAARQIWRGARDQLVGKPHDESESDIKATEIAVLETTDRSAYSRAPNRDWLVRYDLRLRFKAVSYARFDGDPKIRGVDHFRGQLTNDDRGMGLRKGVCLDDHGRSRLPVVAGRRHDDDVTAPHRSLADRARQTQTPSRSSSKRRPRC